MHFKWIQLAFAKYLQPKSPILLDPIFQQHNLGQELPNSPNYSDLNIGTQSNWPDFQIGEASEDDTIPLCKDGTEPSPWSYFVLDHKHHTKVNSRYIRPICLWYLLAFLSSDHTVSLIVKDKLRWIAWRLFMAILANGSYPFILFPSMCSQLYQRKE